MFKNKNNIKIKMFVGALSLFAVTSSCEDLVNEVPISEISQENFFRNNNDLLSGLAATYDGMQGTYNDKTFLWGEFRSDNHAEFGVSGGNNIEILDNNIPAGNGGARWDRFYRMINRANQVINNAPRISGFNEQILGEALAIRAKAYFDAVRVWGDVPVFLESEIVLSNVEKTRTDATEILNTIVIPDMIRAESLMTTLSDDFRFSKSSIYALQAEVYMWVNDNAKAKTALDALVNLGTHSLATTPEAWDSMFYNNRPVTAIPEGRGKEQFGPELIFSIAYNLSEEQNFGGTRNNRSGIMSLFFSGVPTFVMSPAIENKWREKFPVDSTEWVTKYPNVDPVLTRPVLTLDPVTNAIIETNVPVYGDWRYYFCREGRVERFNNFEIGEARTAKWQQTNYPPNDDDTDIVLYRYADMLLLLAEAELKLGNAPRTLELINEVRTARQLPQATTTDFGATFDEQLNFLLDERQLELFGEAKRWWDLVRNDKAIETVRPILEAKGVEGPALSEERLLWPIFVDHLVENPLLTQNSGYLN